MQTLQPQEKGGGTFKFYLIIEIVLFPPESIHYLNIILYEIFEYIGMKKSTMHC